MYGLALVILSAIISTRSHPYGPVASHQTSSSGAGGYVATGNDQLRFHPEESQYYSNQPQPQQTAPVNNAPSYADLVNLAQQEAQQQTIIDAQKKLETNKLVKDIEFIQKQQDLLQQQIHAQEVKNEQKLNNPGGSGGSSYTPQQSNAPGTFNSGQWVPDNNAQSFNNGLYNGEGSQIKASSSTGGSFTGSDSYSGGSAQQSVTQKHHQTGHSGTSNSGSYGGFPSPNQPQSGGGYPEFQSPPEQYPSPAPTSSYEGSSPSGSYSGGSSSISLSSYGGSNPVPTNSYGDGGSIPQFSVSNPQQPTPTNPSYGSSDSSQAQYQSQQEYWWNGPNSPFSQNQLGNCNHLDCNPVPSINKPPPPKPSYAPPPSPPPAQYPPPPPPNSVEPVNINQNPYLSGAINNKPPGPSHSGPSYAPAPPPPSYAPAPPPPSYAPAPPPSSYAPVPPPSYAPPPPPPSKPQTFPQKPYPTKPSPAYQPSKPTPTYNPPTAFPSPPLTNPDAPAGGYGSSGGGTPGISYPEYQPDDVERVPCTQLGHTCVAKHLCVNGRVNSNGIGIIQLRLSMKSCRADIEACCKEATGVEGSYSPPPSSYQPKPTASGSHQSPGPVDSYGQPTSSYALPPGEPCSACDSGTHSHSQSSQETSYHHKEQSSSSHTSGSANLPSAKLPDFGPPSVGGAGYGK